MSDDDYFYFTKPANNDAAEMVFVYPLTFGRARIGIGNGWFINDSW